ncbi:MAG: response regulator [Candidatus Taylorbacteria bacterium]|nr:response regulator [Candidatus Taylorbacteria bacterium]
MENNPYKVLIVDDDKFLLNMYSIKFKRTGIDAVVALSASEALSKLRGGFEPDALIIDIVMPGMDGFELLERIRKENLSPKAAVIFLTNQGQNPDFGRAKSLGVKSYIVKASTVPSEVVAKVMEMVKELREI